MPELAGSVIDKTETRLGILRGRRSAYDPRQRTRDAALAKDKPYRTTAGPAETELDFTRAVLRDCLRELAG
jgi:hypothetical protein